MPMSASCSGIGPRPYNPSLPITTPCSFAPISAPQIQNGRQSNTAWVRRTCGIVMYVHLRRELDSESVRARYSTHCASLRWRSLFFPNNRTESEVLSGGARIVSHMLSFSSPAERRMDTAKE